MVFTVLLIVISTVYLLTNKRYRWFYIIYKTLGRDLRAVRRFVALNLNLWWSYQTKKTVPKIFTQIASKHPDKVAFYFEDQVWTFQDLETYSNRVSHFFKNEGFKRGDAVALLLENKPEYVALWLGLGKLGVVTALINSNLVGDSLVHSIKASDAKGLIYGGAQKTVVKEITDRLSTTIKLYEFPEKGSMEVLDGSVNLVKELDNESDASLTEDIERGLPKDKLIFIYTSGTTGLPKAAVITNMRFIFMGLGMYYMTDTKESDIVYDPLPLYHSAGGIVGAGQCLLRGVTVALRKKFSASNFWSDCVKYNCTVAQYIGEICRYILLAHTKDTKPVKHSVRKLIGNGLRPQIWKEFQEKFNIEEIYEFYGATEGNSNLINIDSKVGSVGFTPMYASFLYPVVLTKCDEVTGELIRGSDGFCQRCKPGEVGLLLGIVDAKKTISDFSGYADKKATQKKLVENVFKKGDLYFNSGDVLVQDEFGYFYFKDRTGDTFRWKGENVSTSEIEAVISSIVNLTDAAVYGVEIPGTEGRAGMAAIVDTNNSLDMEHLCKGLKKKLPAYAIPIFVRVITSMPMTGTFKLKKTDLREEAYNINKIKDKLFMYDAKMGTYVELNKEKYNEILSGKIRL